MTSEDRNVVDELEGFRSFLEVVEEAEESVGEWISRRSDDPSVDLTIGGVRYPDSVHAFSRVLREAGWMQPDYMEVNIARYRDNPALVAEASLPTLKRLLTATERGERFNPGYRAGAYDDGFVLRIVDRLVELRDRASPSGSSHEEEILDDGSE
jgi:hypothetical protein